MTQTHALELLKLGYNVFLTGPAGSGKTHVLNAYCDYLRSHEVGIAITASTGIAATHLGGQTIHSWSGMGIRDHLHDEDLTLLLKNDRLRKNIQKAKVLVIDEISMLHAHQLNMIDRITRHALDFTKPFGGLQVILCGDFFQLPPISSGHNRDEQLFAYECEAWNSGEFQICYLEEQFRQEGGGLLDILNAIRSGRVNERTHALLKSRYQKILTSDIRPTRLYARNKNIDEINARELAALPGDEKIFTMKGHGFRAVVDNLKRTCPASEIIRLKIGAEVLFIKNAPDGVYVNGTRGVVIDFDADGWPIVRTVIGERITVFPEEWRFEENGSVRATVMQVPLRLAWAITIHKSQGMTLDAAEIDLSDAFEPGMGYVALSRLKSLSSLHLLGVNSVALSVHPKTLAHDKKFQEWSEAAKRALDSIPANVRNQKHEEVLLARFGGVREKSATITKKGKAPKQPSYEITRNLVEEQLPLSSIARKRRMTTGTIVHHLETLKSIGRLPDISYLRPNKKVYDEICNAFEESSDGRLIPVFNACNKKHSFDVLRLVRLFLE